ncbi:hypothetical protein AKJ35_00850 [candidate division MSBL1 archaeon SCGC-AAA833F18]|uniref:Uncharacterized protein n=3 Tax=candidate division MSBL1 TaxID=215777 RepID=A0A133V1E7_9EURY|nr:hypothetical protein AKJ42_01345 [candidate division MSBL1 archaeon SCGC-AAA261C02]KXB03915.1 hypothetical protein AKJ47_01450 [candidate division MSBL1 archaeon SCGC-AAA261G05]KXB09422.1 hypothetical protein AKJ35_00850 [candidate division MSBL1 archaeon SCGC-AAA833F18]
MAKKKSSEKPSESIEDVKHRLGVVERELGNLVKFQWKYAKRMLKFGTAAWVFGLAVFVATLTIYQGPGLLFGAPSISISLLVIAAAAPVFITVIMLQRHRRKIKRLERIRRGLLTQYEKTLLKKMEENITK